MLSIPKYLYHGTSARYANDIITQIRLDKSNLPCDFGPGFYTSTQKEWAIARAQLNFNDPVVMIFNLNASAWESTDNLIFQKPTKNFWRFVKKCDNIRIYPDTIKHRKNGYYDVVYGAMVDRTQLILGNEVIFDPKLNGFQVGFHTQLVSQILTFDRVESP